MREAENLDPMGVKESGKYSTNSGASVAPVSPKLQG